MITTGRVFKRCGCRDPETGQQLNSSCPKLRRKDNGKNKGTWRADHGTWHYRIDLPDTPDGQRRHVRRGGLASSDEANTELDRIRTLLAIADENDTTTRHQIADLIVTAVADQKPLPDPEKIRSRYQRQSDLDPKLTVGQWLDRWLAGRRNISRSTRNSYDVSIRLYLTPAIGNVRLDLLTVGHLDDMFDQIDAQNDTIRRIRISGTPAEKKQFKGRRAIGDAYKQRIRATLRAALNTAIRRNMITYNPAAHVELPSGKRPKALLWTVERVDRWKTTGEIPSPVMVWTPQQTGVFLDHADGEPLYALYHLIAHRGLRRGEACAVHWTDLAIDSDDPILTIRWQITQHGADTEMGKPKSDAGDRQISLDTGTVRVLREHRRRQNTQKLTCGPAWPDTGLVFTQPDGTSLLPDHVTSRFSTLVEKIGLPPIRLHDLRHGAATLALAAGADLKAVQALLGHSSITITADTYTHILPELAKEIAENVARLIPRTRKTGRKKTV